MENKIDKSLVSIKFCTSEISEEDYYHKIKAKIFYFDESGNSVKIGFIDMFIFNFGMALNKRYSWFDLIDEENDDMLRLLEPLIKKQGVFSDDFDSILDDCDCEPNSLIAIQRIFIKRKYRGNSLLGTILEIIKNFNSCPIVLTPLPLQHADGESNVKLMGKVGNKKDFKKDMDKLCNHYKVNGFQKVGKSKTWALI